MDVCTCFCLCFRFNPRIPQREEVTKIYSQRFPVYVAPQKISHKQGFDYDNKIPGKGEVVLEDRFTLSRPLFSYEALKKPNNHYHPTSINTDSKRETDQSGLPPTIPPTQDASKDNSDFSSPPASYDSPYSSYNPPNYPVYYYQKPKPSDSKDADNQKESTTPKPDIQKDNNDADTNPPRPSYDSPYSSYNPPERPPSYSYPKPGSIPKPSIYPPYVDAPKKETPKQPAEQPKVPYLEYDPMAHHHHEHNHDHNSEGHDHNLPSDNGSKVPEYLDYDPNDHHHHHHHDDEKSKPDKPDDDDTNSNPSKPEMPKFPPYLYHPPPSGPNDHKHDFPPGTPPYLEYNPYEHKEVEKGPPITKVVEPPSSEGIDNVPQYLDHDHHHFPDFYHYPFPPIYHEIKPLTTTPAPEEKRVNKRPYTYYYIGRKLWYIPLYFSLYFIVYVFVLVLKSIARHKIQFNQYFEENRAMEGEGKQMENLTEHVISSIDVATDKYGD